MTAKITKEFLERHRKMLFDVVEEMYMITTEEFNYMIESAAFSKPVKTFAAQNKLLSESNNVLRVLCGVLSRYFRAYRVYFGEGRSIDEILTEFFDVLIKKNENYGENNIPEIGLLGIANLIKIKISREKTTRFKEVKNYEPHKDTLMDIVNYAILGILLWRDAFRCLDD